MARRTGDPPPPVDESVAPARGGIEEAIRAELGDGAVSKSTARLALAYARAIDGSGANPDVLDALGPKLLGTLRALVLTPEAIAAARKGRRDDPPGDSPGAQLRAEREARMSNPPDRDPAA